MNIIDKSDSMIHAHMDYGNLVLLLEEPEIMDPLTAISALHFADTSDNSPLNVKKYSKILLHHFKNAAVKRIPGDDQLDSMELMDHELNLLNMIIMAPTWAMIDKLTGGLIARSLVKLASSTEKPSAEHLAIQRLVGECWDDAVKASNYTDERGVQALVLRNQEHLVLFNQIQRLITKAFNYKNLGSAQISSLLQGFTRSAEHSTNLLENEPNTE